MMCQGESVLVFCFFVFLYLFVLRVKYWLKDSFLASLLEKKFHLFSLNIAFLPFSPAFSFRTLCFMLKKRCASVGNCALF